jgi:hypothetical protein
LTVSASADEPINETTARQTTKLTNGFLIFTLTSYNEILATRQDLGCDVIARVDGRRSLAQNGRVDTEAPGKRGRQGDKERGRGGDKETRGQGEGETRRQGDKERGRGGDKGTRGQGDKGRGEKEEWDIFSPSPCPLVSPSPPLLVPLRRGPKIRIEGLKKIWKKRYEEKLKHS